ncbi:MAG: type II toxin-antitoxin system VapC family toxin [Candidatus Binatia bacterium]
MRIASSPVYLDTSALAKIYVAEVESHALESAVVGRHDLIVSDLAVTELSSLVARLVRERRLLSMAATALYQSVSGDLETRAAHRVELTTVVHREAERLMLHLGERLPLRAADALHLALAMHAGARTLVTFDRRMTAAARETGVFELPAV